MTLACKIMLTIATTAWSKPFVQEDSVEYTVYRVSPVMLCLWSHSSMVQNRCDFSVQPIIISPLSKISVEISFGSSSIVLVAVIWKMWDPLQNRSHFIVLKKNFYSKICSMIHFADHEPFKLTKIENPYLANHLSFQHIIRLPIRSTWSTTIARCQRHRFRYLPILGGASLKSLAHDAAQKPHVQRAVCYKGNL